MPRLIAFLFPSILSVAVNCKITKKEIFRLESIIMYCGYVLANLLLVLSVLYIIGSRSITIDNNMNNVSFFIKYVSLSVFWALLLPFVYHLIKNSRIQIKVKKTDD